jgi:high-affinity K+ transport system ATPase subunit B
MSTSNILPWARRPVQSLHVDPSDTTSETCIHVTGLDLTKRIGDTTMLAQVLVMRLQAHDQGRQFNTTMLAQVPSMSLQAPDQGGPFWSVICEYP